MNFICKDIEIEIPNDDPFKHDKLKRESVANILTSIIEIYSYSGAVIAIDGEWGSGKTTFIKMWRQYLDNESYKTLYFNAWASDYIEDPLVALMGELNIVFGTNRKLENITKNIYKIGLKIGGEVLKSGAKKFTGIDVNTVSTGIDEAINVCKDSIDAYTKRKQELDDFKNKLGEFVASEAQENEHPIVFFIDELDRCNPHYAVKVLERIKHLFEVPNIIFVLSVNLNQFKHAVQGFYGSKDINGEEYLKRFIDLVYSLPTPNLEDYTEFLYEIHSFNDYFNHNDRKRMGLNREGDSFLYLAKDLISNSNLNPRTANKIFAYTRIALQGFHVTTKIHADLFFLLCFLKLTNTELYKHIKLSELTVEALIEKLETELPQGIFSPKQYTLANRHIAWAIGGLLIKYNYSERGIPKETIFDVEKKEDQSYSEYPIKLNKLSKEHLFKALDWYRGNDRSYEYGLKGMIDRIELISHMHI